MDLKEIMSVSGHSGLFRFISQGRNGIIVESFSDKKRTFVNASQKVSSLADIAIFTDSEEVPLSNVFKRIHDLNPDTPAPDPKSSPDELKKFMEKVLPNYDRDRVYVSDMKKLVSWYNMLLDLQLLNFEEEAKSEKETEVPEPASEEKEIKTEENAQAKENTEDKAKPASARAKKTNDTKKEF